MESGKLRFVTWHVTQTEMRNCNAVTCNVTANRGKLGRFLSFFTQKNRIMKPYFLFFKNNVVTLHYLYTK